MKHRQFQYNSPPDAVPEDAAALDSKSTLVLIFACEEAKIPEEFWRSLQSSFTHSVVMGCSTAGEIHHDMVYEDSLVMSVCQFEATELKVAYESVAGNEDSYEAARRLAEQLKGHALKHVFVLSDGLNVNGSELVSGFNNALDSSISVSGGLAGDGSRFQSTWLLCDGVPCSRKIAGVGFYGESLVVGYGSMGGWDLFGVQRRVTRSQNNVLYELDGKPALALYKEYLGDRASELPASGLLFPLAILQDDQDPIVRTILSIDEEQQAMVFAGDIPQGCRVALMRANFERLIDGAEGASLLTHERLKANGEQNYSDILTIAISCVGRKLVLGSHTEDELEAVLDKMPDKTSQIGFYSYGEIAKHNSGKCELFNQTMTLTTLTEVV